MTDEDPTDVKEFKEIIDPLLEEAKEFFMKSDQPKARSIYAKIIPKVQSNQNTQDMADAAKMSTGGSQQDSEALKNLKSTQFVRVYQNAAICLFKETKYSQAINYSQKCLEKDKSNIKCQRIKGLSHFYLGETFQAEQLLEKLETKDAEVKKALQDIKAKNKSSDQNLSEKMKKMF